MSASRWVIVCLDRTKLARQKTPNSGHERDQSARQFRAIDDRFLHRASLHDIIAR